VPQEGAVLGLLKKKKKRDPEDPFNYSYFTQTSKQDHTNNFY